MLGDGDCWTRRVLQIVVLLRSADQLHRIACVYRPQVGPRLSGTEPDNRTTLVPYERGRDVVMLRREAVWLRGGADTGVECMALGISCAWHCGGAHRGAAPRKQEECHDAEDQPDEGGDVRPRDGIDCACYAAEAAECEQAEAGAHDVVCLML